jgi:hypothetical protein
MRFSPVSTSRSSYGEAFNVPTYREVQAQLVVELRRARRYEYPLGVAALSLQPPLRARGERASGSAPGSLHEVTPAVYGLLGAYLRNLLRETDILTGVPESLAYATFLPGVDREGAGKALERFRDGFRECSGFDLRGGVAAFPDDGLTIEDVLDRACDAWRQARRRDSADLPEARYSRG